MEILNNIRGFISRLDEQKFFNYTAIFLGVLALLFGFFLYQGIGSITDEQERIETINDAREEAQDLIARFEQVKKQRAKVNKILTEDRRFKISDYFNKLLEKHNLERHLQTEPKVAEDTLDRNYKEVRITPLLKQINMRQLTQLLQDIEDKERVYIKKLDITKTEPASIDAMITIATLQPLEV